MRCWNLCPASRVRGSSAAHGGEAEGTEAEESLPQDPKRNKGGHEESQEEKAEATEGKRKKKERHSSSNQTTPQQHQESVNPKQKNKKQESILILIVPFFFSIGGYQFLIKSLNAISSWVQGKLSQNIGWGGRF